MQQLVYIVAFTSRIRKTIIILCSSQESEVKMSRLNYEKILTIYKYMSLDYQATQIAGMMHIARSTIYRIIRNNIEIKYKYKGDATKYPYLDCVHIGECKKTIKRCPNACERLIRNLCPKLLKFPFICDFCEIKGVCGKEHHLWNPVQVESNRMERLRSTRKHLYLSKKKLMVFNDWITPFIKKQLSVEAIYSQYPEAFPASTSTVRRWIDQGQLTARRIDLLRAVRFKTKKEYQYKRPSNRDPLAKYGHTYQYFLDYVKLNPKASIIEMDTVHGQKTEEMKLLTFYHRQSHLQFGILIPNSNSSLVSRELKHLQNRLGNHYQLLFEIILADNGTEFDDLIKTSVHPETGVILSNVFYTRPYNSGDKGGCERNHELFRYLVPKGHCLSDFMQEDINFMFSMINSYPRESLNWKTPIDVFIQYFPKELLNTLSIKKIPLDEINLKR